MDYTKFFEGDKTAKVAIIGASRGYGFTLLTQLLHVDKIELKVACSRDLEETKDALLRAGYSEEKIKLCATKEDVISSKDDEILVVDDYNLVYFADITSIVESTGNVEIALDASEKALENGLNVYMVSKEMDSICGPYLNNLAHEKGLVYTLVNGDQPRNLLDLFSWVEVNGHDIVACGKSSEYDFVWDRVDNTITYTDGSGKFEKIEGMEENWAYQGISTLENRQEILKEYTNVIAADLCEMNLVSNIVNFKPAQKFLSYPIAKTKELADIFIPKEDGGILDGDKRIDVFYQLRETEESSFAGGEFVIVRCTNKETWDVLASKGHVVSKNKKYACIFWPYHIMGAESPVTILLGDLKGIGTRPECRQHTIMSGLANKTFEKGTTLSVLGHHHQIEGLTPQLLVKENNENVAPFYLLNGATLLNDVKEGSLITLDDVDLSTSKAFEAYKKGMGL